MIFVTRYIDQARQYGTEVCLRSMCMSGLSCGFWTNTSIGFTVAIRKERYHLRVCCKTPGAQNVVRVALGAPGAAVILHTWSVQSSRQVSLSGNHCSRCFWE